MPRTGPHSPRRTPLQARSRATVDKVLAGAAQVFAEEGYAVTTDRIARRAGVSVGSLYQYFPSKDALLLELARRHLSEAGARIGQVLQPGRPSAQWLPEAVAAMAELHAEADLHRVIYEQAPRTVGLVDAFEEMGARATAGVAALLTAEHDLPDAELPATVLVAMIESLTHRLVGVLTQEQLIPEVTRAASAYLTTAMGGAAAGTAAPRRPSTR